MIKQVGLQLVLFSMVVGICAAQSSEPSKVKPEPRFYRLDLVLKEFEGGTTNSRTYSEIGSTENGGFPSVRTGSRIPIPTGSGDTTYLDVGVNVDFRFLKEENGDVLSLVATVEVSGLAGGESQAASQSSPPVIRQTRWSGAALLPFRKPVVIFTSDDVTSKRKLQVELTATPLKQ